MRLAAAALLFALIATPAAAREDAAEFDLDSYDRGCMDEYARDLCNEAVRAKITESFGALTAERLARQGWDGVRVFTIDGYSNDMPLISIAQRDDRRTDLDVRIVGPEGPVTLETRARGSIRRAADDLRRTVLKSPERLPEEPPAESLEELVICLHPWVVMVEVIEGGRVVRRIRDGCRGDAVFERAIAVSMLPIEDFPHCDRLRPDDYRNNSARLEACARLFGPDLLASADIFNRIEADFSTERDLFTSDARFEPMGDAPANGPAAVKAAWEAINMDDMWFGAIRADDGKANVKGKVWRYLNGDNTEVADFTQNWVLEKDGVWRISRVTLSAFKPR